MRKVCKLAPSDGSCDESLGSVVVPWRSRRRPLSPPDHDYAPSRGVFIVRRCKPTGSPHLTFPSP